MMKQTIVSSFAIALLATSCAAQKLSVPNVEQLKTEASKSIQQQYDTYKDVALDIWGFAELGYQEVKSSNLLQDVLNKNGFKTESGVAGIPTAFVSSYGSGKPVIAILAEFDALPGLTQDASPEKSPAEGRTSGHGCGHHLFGTGSVAAAIAIKELMVQGKIKGTVRVYGCPAEEGGSGKVYLVREGLFKDVDVAVHWHPDDINATSYTSSIANKSAKFRFYGVSAHAASAPQNGRSALDAVEAMNYMVNMMREHVPQESRIHYVITDGGKAPNVVPDFAEVYYYVRHPERSWAESVFERIVKASEGAALGTGTTTDYEIIGGTHDLLINKTLAEAMQANLLKIGGVEYTEAEKEFAAKISKTFIGEVPDVSRAGTVMKAPHIEDSRGSTDVGDVSYVVPTVGMRAATWVPGTSAHSWQAVASGGTEIGTKGMMVAAKSVAAMAIDLFTNPKLIEDAKAELKASVGDYEYKAMLGDRKPALDYRN